MTSSSSIRTEKDAEGLQLALRELFEESYLLGETAGIMSKSDEETRARIQDDMPERSISPGYYGRAVYLLDLASAIERGVQYSAGSLTPDDVRGLDALKRAKQEFERDHPQCPACSIRQPNQYMMQCVSCKTKFAGRGA